jgi:hypothetical protein
MVTEEEVSSAPYSESDKAMDLEIFGEDDSEEEEGQSGTVTEEPAVPHQPTPPLPPRPFTTEHPEITEQKPIAKWFVADDTGNLTLFEGTLKYFLPKAPGRPHPLFRVEYADNDFEDINKTELKLQQQLAAKVAKERANRQNRGRNLPIQISQLSAQPPSEYPIEEEDSPIYWHAQPDKETNPVVSTNTSTSSSSSYNTSLITKPSRHPMLNKVIRAFIATYEDRPTYEELKKLQHLKQQTVVTQADIKAAFEPFETDVDNQESAAGVKAFNQAFGMWPSAAEQQWVQHVTYILERTPTTGELQEAAKGPVRSF